MGRIFIIGGGSIRERATLPFDRRIARLTGKKRPKVLFIPTASDESKIYCEAFQQMYGKRLGCKVDILFLLHQRPSFSDVKRRILGSDVIYVGGGNTLKMMRRWRFLGVDRLLKQAYRRNIVLAGVSAGGICWFDSGHSDSMSFYRPKKWKYIAVSGLGLIKGIHCPHFNGSTARKLRRKDFQNFMKTRSQMGIAIDNHAAMEFIDGTYRVLAIKPNCHAYRVYRHGGSVQTLRLPESNRAISTQTLYSKKIQ